MLDEMRKKQEFINLFTGALSIPHNAGLIDLPLIVCQTDTLVECDILYLPVRI